MVEEKIRAFVVGEVAGLTGQEAARIGDDMQLVGSETEMESRELVELMLACEDFLETEFGAAFNWYSDSALSGARSRLRTVGTLVELIVEKAAGCDA